MPVATCPAPPAARAAAPGPAPSRPPTDALVALHLRGVAGSVAQARHHVRAVLAEHGHHALVDDAELAVSELVGNVVVHARTDCDLVVRVEPRRVLLLVRDGDPTLPVARAADEDDLDGRGLALVDAGAAARGAERAGDGKVVWCALAA